MPEFKILIVLCLATWRISALLTYEAGPFNSFLELREKAGIIHDDEGEVIGHDESFIARVLECLWCNSLWVGAIMVIFAGIFQALAIWLLLPFALSAGAIVLERGIRG